MPEQSGTKYDAFLCHSSAQKDWTRDLARRMRDSGLNVWFNEWSIRGGENMIHAMERGTRASRHLIFVASPEAIGSDWTSFEESIAMLEDASARKREIIPVLHTHCELPPRLQNRQYIDFTDTHADKRKYEFKLAQLIANIDPSREPPMDYDKFSKSLGDSDLGAIPSVTPLPPGSRMGMRPNPCFVGREEELKKIAESLNMARTMAIGQVEAVTGLGGIGKTQLAVEYVHRYGSRYPGGVFWLAMEDVEGIRNEIAQCGGADGMNLPGFDQLGQHDKVKSVLSIWREDIARLLVFDNVEKPEEAQQWIPASGGARVLITSRRRDWPASMGIDPLPLEVLPPDESLKLLLKNRPEALESNQEASAAKRVCETLGHLPLALDMARAYLGKYKNEISLVDYERELTAKPVLEDASLVDFVTDPSPTRHIQNIAATFDVSYKELNEDNKIDALAMKLFHMASHFAPTSISRELLGMTAGIDPEDSDDRKTQGDAINRLASLGLIQKEEDDRLLMHRLLREFALRRLPPGANADECADSFEEAIFTFATEEDSSDLPARLVDEFQHLRHAAQRAAERESENAGRLFTELGHHQNAVADYEGARKNYEMALEIDEIVYGPDHPGVAIDLNNIGSVLYAQGDLEGARKSFEQALEIDEKTLGPDHPDVGLRLTNLGAMLLAQGDLEDAKKNFERALEIYEKTYGVDHPKVAIRLNNLGSVLEAQGDWESAKKDYERALEIDEKTYGPAHPEVAADLVNLGSVLRAQGDLNGAKKNYERALEIQKKILGTNHPAIATSLNNLSYVLRAQGDLEGARKGHQRALEINENAYGLDHPYIAISLTNLGSVLEAQGDWESAENNFERALEIGKKTHGLDHPSVAITYNSLGGLFARKNQYARAIEMFEKATEARPQTEDLDISSVGLLNLAESVFEGSPDKSDEIVLFLAKHNPVWLAERQCDKAEISEVEFTSKNRLVVRLKTGAVALTRVVDEQNPDFGWQIQLTSIEAEEGTSEIIAPEVEAGRIARNGVEITADTSDLPLGLYMVMVRFLADGREQWRADRTISSREMRNPFIPGPPVEIASQLFGRSGLIDGIMQDLEFSSIVLMGPRRSGKTSVLYRLRDLAAKDWHVAWLDLHDYTGSSREELLLGLSREVLRACNLLPPASKTAPSLFDLKEQIGQSGVERVLLLIDEMAVLAEHPDVAHRLRGMSKWVKKGIRIVVAGTKRDFTNVDKVVMGRYGSAPFGEFTNRLIDSLTFQDARDLLEQPVLGHYRYEEEAMQTLLDFGAGRPFFLKTLAYLTLEATRREGGPLIRQSHVKEAQRKAPRELDPRYREYMYELGPTVGEALKKMVRDAKEPVPSKYEDALSNVALVVTKDGRTFLDSIFIEWWLENEGGF